MRMTNTRDTSHSSRILTDSFRCYCNHSAANTFLILRILNFVPLPSLPTPPPLAPGDRCSLSLSKKFLSSLMFFRIFLLCCGWKRNCFFLHHIVDVSRWMIFLVQSHRQVLRWSPIIDCYHWMRKLTRK